MNLKKELELLYGNRLCDDAVAAITKPYRIANGIEGRIVKESDKQAVLDIERAKLSKQAGLIVSAAKPIYSKKYEYKTITLSIDKTRHVIKLERFYIDALESIGIVKLAVWLSVAVAKEWNETTGDKSIAKIVKSAIVSELVRRASKV